MKEYTVAEFRANTREILNSVDQGREVVLIRYDARYSIKPISKGTFKVDPESADLEGANIARVRLKPGVEKAPGDVVTADEIAVDEAKKAAIRSDEAAADLFSANKRVKQAQKKINKTNEKISKAASKKLKELKDTAIEAGLCEHYQAKGNCMVKGCKYGNKN